MDLAAESGGRKRASLRRDVTSLGAHSQAGLLGLVGWSVVLPTVLGVVLGVHRPALSRSALLDTYVHGGRAGAGLLECLALDCREQREIEREQKENGHE